MDKLGNTYFFRDLTPDELDAVRSITRIADSAKGSLVLRQGQPSDDLFVVRTGSVRVMVPAADDEDVPTNPEQTLVVLGPGECFGEFAFVDRKPSSATVIANEDSTLYAIGHQRLDALIEQRPALAAKVYRALLGILVARFRNTDIELAMRRAIGG